MTAITCTSSKGRTFPNKKKLKKRGMNNLICHGLNSQHLLRVGWNSSSQLLRMTSVSITLYRSRGRRLSQSEGNQFGAWTRLCLLLINSITFDWILPDIGAENRTKFRPVSPMISLAVKPFWIWSDADINRRKWAPVSSGNQIEKLEPTEPTETNWNELKLAKKLAQSTGTHPSKVDRRRRKNWP